MEMAGQEKSFKELQQDERLKRLERQLKLNQAKRPNSSQHSPSTRMSISGISSIHGDNAFSDFSFSSSQASSRAGSVILTSSLNLRKNRSANLENSPNAYSPATSSVFEQNSTAQKADKDRAMMPPPLPSTPNGHNSQIFHKTGRTGRATVSMSKQSCPLSYESENYSQDETYRSDHNATLERLSLEEPSRIHDAAVPQGRAWKNWIVRLNKDGQIIIKGKLESGDGARSKAIKKRISATAVVSVFNHVYRLVGDLHDVREELPEYVRGKFYNGFPTDWENVCQVWRSYVISGYSLSFRWPRPMADSDDDLRSDITDLTVSHLKNSKITPVSISSPPHSRQGAREIDRSLSKGDSQTSQKVASDITLSGPKENESKMSCGNSGEALSAPSDSSNRSWKTGNGQSTICQRIPKCKIDIIVHNLMDKNCSVEYIDKFITAMNCFNELFALPPTVNAVTAPDEGVFLTYNSNSQSDKTNNESLKHDEPFTVEYRKAAAAGPSDSFSIETDSEEEPSSKHETYVCQGTSVRKVKSLAESGGTRHLERKEKPNTPTLTRAEAPRKSISKNRNEQRPIFETTDTDGETVVPELPVEKPRARSANRSSLAAASPRRVRHQLVATERINEGVEKRKSDAGCDSDVSIIGTCGTPVTNPRIPGECLSTPKHAENPRKRGPERGRQRSNRSVINDEKNGHSQANSAAGKKSANLSNKKTTGSSAAQATDECTGQLTKIAVAAQRTPSNSSFSKSEKTPKERPNLREKENVSWRTSSSGRRIVPPLHYWEGERMSLIGREVVYSSGTERLGTASMNSSALKNSSIFNRTAVSEPGLNTTNAKKLTETPVGSRERARHTGNSTTISSERTGGILMEISPNHNGNTDHAMPSDQGIERTPSNTVPEVVKRNRRGRAVRKKSDSSSGDERIPVVRQMKRRRMH